MVRLGWLLFGALGCGRLGFDARTADSDAAADTRDGASGLDEDGDGVPDSEDHCPFLLGGRLDSDGDGVGDDCDWEPAIPRQRFALATAMVPGQPLTIRSGSLEQRADSLYFAGPGFADIVYPVATTDIQIDIGLDVVGVVGSGVIHQIAIGANGPSPDDFAELNEMLGVYSQAQLTRFDGTNYIPKDTRTLVGNLHAGRLTMHVLLVPGGAATATIAWPGEVYELRVPLTAYTQATEASIHVNNVELALRYVVVVKRI